MAKSEKTVRKREEKNLVSGNSVVEGSDES